MSAWRYFKIEDFRCRCGCGTNLINHEFVDELDELRHHCGFALTVTSGYRCPTHNAAVSSTGLTGPHTTGRAADLGVDREKALRVLSTALLMKFTGVGVNQKGAGRFIHLDNLPNSPTSPRPTVWSY